jgi:hypothetical protein
VKLGAILTVTLALLPTLVRAAAPAPVPVTSCIESAAMVYHVPAAVVLILLSVEGGALGQVSPNTNNTVDIGPMQVNTIWVPVVASHWRATPAETYAALRDNFCANVEAGTWILRQAIDQAHGDFWEGVGFYHSHNPGYKADYLRKVLRQTLRLQAQALRQADAKHSVPSGN